jgi:hypothetical protein
MNALNEPLEIGLNLSAFSGVCCIILLCEKDAGIRRWLHMIGQRDLFNRR